MNKINIKQSHNKSTNFKQNQQTQWYDYKNSNKKTISLLVQKLYSQDNLKTQKNILTQINYFIRNSYELFRKLDARFSLSIILISTIITYQPKSKVCPHPNVNSLGFILQGKALLTKAVSWDKTFTPSSKDSLIGCVALSGVAIRNSKLILNDGDTINEILYWSDQDQILPSEELFSIEKCVVLWIPNGYLRTLKQQAIKVGLKSSVYELMNELRRKARNK